MNDSSSRCFDPVEMIQTRRQGLREHTDEEIDWWIRSYRDGEIPDYQMAAWLMAACFNTLSVRETAALTRSMVSIVAFVAELPLLT